ncbi:MAG: 30S ribosomal protein S1 [Candidatus Symbiodolus clandestinus]
MATSFAQLFQDSLEEFKRPGAVVRGVVTAIVKGGVIVDAGLKSESIIPIEQFQDSHGELEVGVGDEVDVVLDAIEDGFGETQLSREKAKRHETWAKLAQSYEQSTVITGLISGKVKGGFTVELDGIRAFLPGSLIELRPIRDTSHLEGKELEFKVIKFDPKRNNVVVSRRAVLEAEGNVERSQLLDSLQEGMVVKGIVKNLTDYGAFIDLGGVDGLLHITDMAWKRVKDPHECVAVGEEIRVKVLKFDRDRNRVSLGLKQLGEDPWIAIAKRCPIHSKITGKVTNLTDYGCFAEIEEGVEGLVHVSEMDWTNKNIHPSKVVSIGETIEVMILDIDEDRRRISLGLKQCKGNPWQHFNDTYQKNCRIQGKVKSITDFGIFIGLPGNIDGLVHLSDISWDLPGEEAVTHYKKGDEIEAMLLQVDVERERISLGIKQLSDDPFNRFLSDIKKGEWINGTIATIDAKQITLNLSEGVVGRLSAAEVKLSATDKSGSITAFTLDRDSMDYTVGSELKTQYSGVDRKNRVVTLTLKIKDESDSKQSASENEPTNKSVFADAMSEAFRAAKGKQ